jgi:predicted RNA-binding protein associated with RNAse of E/G family
MKRKTANRANRGDNLFKQKQFENDDFQGIIAQAKIEKANKVIFVGRDNDVCIIDDGYCWIEMYPDNENYAITTIFDDKGRLVEWYIDAVLNCKNEDGIVCYDDLYLDISINPKGQWIMLDEDELLQARDDGEITQKEVDLAYESMARFKEKYLDNFENLKKFTKCVCDEFEYQWLD